MSTPTALPEVMKQLQEEAERTPPLIVRPESWNAYRAHQQMWNPNWAPAAELDIYRPE